MPTVLQVVHGYPPREVAGTELATWRLAKALRKRGWRCHVLASTRAPGRAQYACLREPGDVDVTRIVNNLPHRPLGDAERDEAIESLARRVLRAVRPDIVHVQHLAFLSSGLRFDMPVVGTLHDHWPWCPAGGAMLRWGREPCPGPDPGTCPPCYAQGSPMPGTVERSAVGLARALSPVIAPERLHRGWRRVRRRLPASWQARLRGPTASPGSAADALRRNEALGAAWKAMDLRMAPSNYLAEQARARGLGPVTVVSNGAPPAPRRTGGGPLVFLGTLAPHKGAHLVVQAYGEAFPGDTGPGLRIYGAPGADAGYVGSLGWPLEGPLDPVRVPTTLAGATALVMGSLWPENAPLVVLEARAAGCPVVAPRIGGLPELVEDGRDGYLYEPGDVADLVRALHALLAGDPLSVSAPPSLREHAARVEEIYRSLM